MSRCLPIDHIAAAFGVSRSAIFRVAVEALKQAQDRQRGTGPRTDEGLVNTLNDAEQEDAGEKLPVAMK